MRYPYVGEFRLPHACSDILREVVDANSPIWYLPWAREYLLERSSGGFSILLACPFCALPLPLSLRDSYFDSFPGGRPAGWHTDGDSWWRDDARYRISTLSVEPEPPSTYFRPADREESLLIDHLIDIAGMGDGVSGISQGAVVEVGPHGEFIAVPDSGAVGESIDFEDESGDLSLTVSISGRSVCRIDFWAQPTEWWRQIPPPTSWKVV